MKIKIGFFAIMLFLSLLLSHSLFSLATLLAALLHELGHILAARLFKIHFSECKMGLYGIGLIPDNSLFSYGQEILLCAAGPVANFLLAFSLFLLLPHYPNRFLEYLLFSSVALGCLNLIPIRDFDGGRILRAILSPRCSAAGVERIISVVSFLCILSVWSLSVYLLIRASSSLSLFIFSISLFCRIFIPKP